MNKRQVAEIFSLWALNWPSNEMFQGGQAILDARISLFASRLSKVDNFYGKKAAIRAIDTRRFPPNIAEFLEDVAAVEAEIENRCSAEWDALRYAQRIKYITGKTDAQIYSDLSPVARLCIDAMGGLGVLASRTGCNRASFRSAYHQTIRTIDETKLLKG